MVRVFQDHCVEPDDKDLNLARDRIEKYRARAGPRVGDFVIMKDGTKERFAHNWGDGLQTTTGGSFHLDSAGYASMSGGLHPTIPNEKIIPTCFHEEGIFWMFHHDDPCASNSIGIRTYCEVYRVI